MVSFMNSSLTGKFFIRFTNSSFVPAERNIFSLALSVDNKLRAGSTLLEPYVGEIF
jgi:hypothetical protein